MKAGSPEIPLERLVVVEPFVHARWCRCGAVHPISLKLPPPISAGAAC